MDYKARHGKPLTWTHRIFEAAHAPEPFNVFSSTYLKEIVAPDESTVFLELSGDIDETKGTISSYGIEAASSCPVRKAFEIGEMSWLDFWEHRGWLIQFTFDLQVFKGPIRAEFISPSQINKDTYTHLRLLGNQSPFAIKRQQLEAAWRCAARSGIDLVQAEREYRSFLIRHGSKIDLKAA